LSRAEVSAGGIVYRKGDEGVEIVLVRRHAENLVALPKGKLDPGESLQEAAVREVREETGLEVEVVTELSSVQYWFTDREGERVDKVVHFFLMEVTGGDLSLHDHEFDDAG